MGEFVDEFDERITEIMIDATIPIKLLFLINAMPIEKIIKDETGVAYCTGDPEAVGKKLLELEEEVVSKEIGSTSSQTLNNPN